MRVREDGLNIVAAVFAVVADGVNRTADFMMGKKFLSVRAICSSIGLSVISLTIYGSAERYYWADQWRPPIYVHGLTAAVGIIAVAVAASMPMRRSMHIFASAACIVGVTVLSVWPLATFITWIHAVATPSSSAPVHIVVRVGDLTLTSGDSQPEVLERLVRNQLLYTISPGIVLSFMSDVLFIAATRWLLKRLLTTKSMGRVLAVLIAETGLAAILILTPYVVIRMSPTEAPLVTASPVSASTLRGIAAVLLRFNALDGFIVLSLLLMAMIVLVHGALCSFLGRLLETIEAEKAILYRKVLLGLGFTLIGLRIVPFAALIKLLQGAG
jgi:hypothetical protein